ncbi:hypothetical protein V2J09_010850 [Rumex salicifolius]
MSCCSHGFSMDFYSFSCPTVEIIVRDAVRSAASSDPSVPGKLLRLLFHDCFVEGCDGSVLLEGNKTERSDPANTSLGGFQVIDAAKSSLEVFCPFTVSCADVLALAARDAVFLAGGPLIQIPTGRRDGRVSAMENVRPNIVDTTFTLDQMITIFSSKGLSLQDLVVLSGAHTIGSAHCSAFSDRLQMDSNGKPKATDSSLDESYAAQLAKKCVQVAAVQAAKTTVHNDPQTSSLFDNQYYKNLAARKGLFHSDSVLFEDERTRAMVDELAADEDGFFGRWGESFFRLSSVGIKGDDEGEVRRRCWMPN